MPNPFFERVVKHIITGFNVIKTKFHLEEIAGGLIEVASHFHRSIGRFLEAATRQLPVINMLIEAIGNIAAIITFRKKKTAFDKAALGIKVTAGLTTLGVAIAAFAVPHISVPLIVAGSTLNLIYNYFAIYKVSYRKKKLEAQLKTIPLQNETARQEIEDKIESLHETILEHKKEIVHKTVNTLASTIALVGVIIMLANPITAAPISVILAVTSVLYACYHFRKPILSGLKRLGNAIKNIVSTPPQDDATTDTPQPTEKERDGKAAATADFLQHQQNALTHPSNETFAQHHAPTTHDTSVSDFLTHEEIALKTLATTKPTTIPSITITDADEEDEDDGGEGRGDYDASRESRVEPELRM